MAVQAHTRPTLNTSSSSCHFMLNSVMLAAVAALSIGPISADSLPKAERAVLAHVDAHNNEALALLERLVNINSGTQNFAGVKQVGAILRAELDALGFTTRWEDGTPFKRAGHLIAERTGKGPRLLLIGHLDTVFEPDNPFQRFTRLNDSTASGPGVIDMKGGDVIIVQALKALKAAGLLEQMSITAVFHGDEESAGTPVDLARRSLRDAARQSQIALGFEDGDGDPSTAVAARRGASSWVLTVHGTPAHSSQIFRDDIGPGALFEGARILTGFHDKLTGDPLVTFSPGVAVGGTAADLDTSYTRGSAAGKNNVVAERMVVSGDLRTISAEALNRAKTIMREIVSTSYPHTSATIEFKDGYPPMAPTEGNKRLLARLDGVSRELGFGAIGMDNPAKAGAADVSFAAEFVPMAIDGLGLGGHDDHTAKETADLRTLPMLTKRAAVLMYRLTKGGGAQ